MIFAQLSQSEWVIDRALLKVHDTAFASIRVEIYMIAFLLFITGYLIRIWKDKSNSGKQIATMAYIGVLILFSASIPFWQPLCIQVAYYPAKKLYDANSAFHFEHFRERIKAMDAPTASELGGAKQEVDADGKPIEPEKPRFNLFRLSWDAVWSLVLAVTFWVIQIICDFIAYVLVFYQQALSRASFALMPIAFGLMAIPSLSQKGATYIAMSLSFLAWPFCIAVVAATANLALDAFQSNYILSAVAATFIYVSGVIMTPPACYYIFTQGGFNVDPAGPINSALRKFL
jgi:hypothetical protein